MSGHGSAASGGVGLPALLTLLFVGLRLTGHISWSWWWVLSPLWISFCLAAAVVLLVLVLRKGGDS